MHSRGATTTGPDATHPVCQNVWGEEGAVGGVGGGGGDWLGGGAGIGGTAEGGFPRGGGAARDPILLHAYLEGGMCVWGYGGMEVCMRQ